MYITKDRHQTYYLRIVLDKNTRDRLGQGEYRRSLGTKSIKEARRLLPEAYVAAQRFLQEEHVTPTSDKPRLSVFFSSDYIKHLEVINLRPKSIEDKKIILNILVFIIGDLPIDAYTREHARKFRDTALTLPPRVSGMVGKGLSLQEITKQTEKTVTVSTVNNWVRNLSAMFGFALQEGLISNNPFTGLSIAQRNIKVSSLRDAFTMSEVNTIMLHVKEHYTLKDSRYWIILIGGCTGMRLGEITQLYKDNIIQHQDHWCIQVTAEKEDQSIKNVSSERIIPIPQYLLDMGFITYVQSLPDNTRIFNDLKYSKLLGYSSGISKWFSATLKRMGIKTPDRKVSFHSFRHFVATELKNRSVPEHITAEILGHSNTKITYGRYGKSVDVSLLKETLDKINT